VKNFVYFVVPDLPSAIDVQSSTFGVRHSALELRDVPIFLPSFPLVPWWKTRFFLPFAQKYDTRSAHEKTMICDAAITHQFTNSPIR
jgi:hypothetical protein